MKTLAFIQRNDSRFAVGDFYPVLSVFSHHDLGTTTSPFLLLDHLGPAILPAKSNKKGVNEHPHRGFETVTLMFDGELEHQDSTGGGGVIAAGDVQWMTAGAGVIHREHFSPAFRASGGRFEMVQLWVNLPAQYKLVPARYQSLTSEMIPTFPLANNAGKVRLIAGEYNQKTGPAQTYSPIQLLDVHLHKGQSVRLPALHGETTLIYLRSGKLDFSDNTALESQVLHEGVLGDQILDEQMLDEQILDDQGLAVMSSFGEGIWVTAVQESYFLLLNGKPLNEPLTAHGPFVMNSYEEIVASYEAIKTGEFGKAT